MSPDIRATIAAIKKPQRGNRADAADNRLPCGATFVALYIVLQNEKRFGDQRKAGLSVKRKGVALKDRFLFEPFAINKRETGIGLRKQRRQRYRGCQVDGGLNRPRLKRPFALASQAVNQTPDDFPLPQSDVVNMILGADLTHFHRRGASADRAEVRRDAFRLIIDFFYPIR